MPEPALGVAAQDGLLTGGFLCRALRTIAAVERMIQRQPVVALCNGVVRVFEGFNRRSVLFGGVAIGAGSPRRINRTLRLIHFAGGRRSAGNQEEPRAKAGGVQPERIATEHQP